MNAIIMAAGTASRFVPLSEEIPKGLLEVRGEILIERQIRQLREAGIHDITIVLGYQADKFLHLSDKYGVRTVYNEDFSRYNNASSMIRVVDRLEDTFICCSDHYFTGNVFQDKPEDSYYASLFAVGDTGEYCLIADDNGWIDTVQVGGRNSWYMAGHAFFNATFSEKFRRIFVREYAHDEVRLGYWEDIFIRHISELPMKLKKYANGTINEFDSIDELRTFDPSYVNDTRSSILKSIAQRLSCEEREMSKFIRTSTGSLAFTFECQGKEYLYDGRTQSVSRI